MRFALLLTVVTGLGFGQTSPLEPLRFLVGKWVSSPAASQLGQASGDASFRLMLNGRIMVRDSFADYGAAAPRHDDMLVIFAEGAGNALKAAYYDSEGHVIHYRITVK